MIRVGLLTLSLSLLMSTAASAQSPKTLAPRILADQAIKDEFGRVNFFVEGEGMHVSPGLMFPFDLSAKILKKKKKKFSVVQRRYGLLSVDSHLVGIDRNSYHGHSVGTITCIACHSGKAAGRYIIGIGNKNIDVGALGHDLYWAEKLWKVVNDLRFPSKGFLGLEDSALHFTKTLRRSRVTNLTQGLVPTSIVREWFYDQAGIPVPDDLPRAAVKVPHLFGYGEKKKIGQFCDGAGNGNLPGWGIAVILPSGQRPETVRTYVDQLQHLEDSLGNLLPPPYPFSIDAVRAKRGETVFNQTCSRCHGTYEFDADHLPIYKAPKLIPWKVVKTDHDRLDGIDAFAKIVNENPLHDIIQATPTRERYFSPRLHAVWARFPYLHNGSVPSVFDLLTPASERPKTFSLLNAGEADRFDPVRLGLKIERNGSEMRTPRIHWRWVYDTSLQGQSNEGHEFGTQLDFESKLDLIEYLKTL